MNWFEKIWKSLDDKFSADENERIQELVGRNNNLTFKIAELEDDLASSENEIEILQEHILLLESQNIPDKQEELWNNKIKPTSYLYPARHIYGKASNSLVDPRIFFVNDNTLPRIGGLTNDLKAMEALNYVNKYVSYVTDEVQFKRPESWLFPFETWTTRRGDCEDGAILMANIMLASGIPYYRIRLNAGDVKGGGHCWVTYLREEDNEWYVMDWCYWPAESKKWLKWKDAEKYYDIWFSFNRDYVFKKDVLDREVV